MPRYVALLRSVNVAGHGRIAMAELVRSFDSLGYTDVSTYIQTGNVLFTASSKSTTNLAARIADQLATDFGSAPAVILRTVPELLRIGKSSPYTAKGADPARHHSPSWPRPRPRTASPRSHCPEAVATSWSSTAGRSTSTRRTATRTPS